MGRLATVQANFVGVSLPSATGVNQALGAAQTVVLTEAEAVSTPVAALVTLGAITLGAANSLPEPARPQADKLAYLNQAVAQFTAATGGAVLLGSNVVTGPAAGVTYLPNFLQVAPNNPKIATQTTSKTIIFPPYPGSGQVGNKSYVDGAIVQNAPIVGAQAGGLSEVNIFHVQGAVVSVAPTAKNWLNADGAAQTARTSGTTNLSATVTDPLAVATDNGRLVTGTGIPANTYVGTVTAGVGYLLSSSPTSQVNANATVTNASAALTLGSKTLTQWPAGTVPAFTASVGAVDYFQFVTYDGGRTWLNTLTLKGFA